jgi:hypothetical protein
MSLQPEQAKKEGEEDDVIENLFVPLPASDEVPHQEDHHVGDQEIIEEGDDGLNLSHEFSFL